MFNLKILTLFQLISFQILYLIIREASCQELYVGCFTNFSGFSSNNNQIQTVSQCLDDCGNQSFAALKGGSSCYCGNITNTRVPSSNCNVTCSDNNGTCGGRDYYAVYTGIQTYYGCFKDPDANNRDLTFLAAGGDYRTGTMTIEKCYNLCSAANYSFMGLQFYWYCFCGQQYGKYGKAPESECYLKCDGNGNQICGGGYRNSVYSVGYVAALNKRYSEVFHCLSGTTDRYGTCINKTCQPGWKGPKCNQRDCSIVNGNCGIYEDCTEITIGGQNISECLCKKGFQFYGNCTDIDECLSNVCDNDTSVCHNTIGSFECICKQGFKNDSANPKKCIDIDECVNNPCVNVSETCRNTLGSFTCTCSPGYIYNGSDCGADRCNKTLYECNENPCVVREGYECVASPFSTSVPEVLQSNVGKIVGGVLGTLAVIGVVVAVGFLIKKRLIGRGYHGEVITDFPSENEKEVAKETYICVSDVMKYFADHKKDINDQFNKCPKDFNYPQLAAVSPENVMKNRFKKMYPYDHNRVKLNDENDYINASVVETFGNPSDLAFIAAQGPKFETTEDFWKMVWDKNVKVIVMLTNCQENGKEKCYQYWHDGGNMAIGDFVVKTDEKEDRLNYSKRIFRVVLNSEEIEVCHYFYTAWPDKTVPQNVYSMINLREKVMSLVDKKSHNNIVVHCSAGVGRTGTFIALDYLIRQAEREGCVDFYECMKFLRNQRCNMIQAPSQYELCFRAMAMFHKIGKSTFVSTTDLNFFRNNVEKLSTDLIQKQYELIEEEVGSNEVKAVNKVSITSTARELDGVYLPSSDRRSAYVACTITTAFSLELLKNVSDSNFNVIILLDPEEISFWSDEYQQILHKNAIVKLDNKEETDFYTKYAFIIEKNCEMTYENVELSGGNLYMNTFPKPTLIQVTKDVTTNYDAIIDLYSFVKPLLEMTTEKRKIAIFSRGSYDFAGFLISAFNIMQMMEISKEIDIYETVFELRIIQPKIIKNIDLYEKLYSFAKHYVNHSRTIQKTGRKTLMENTYENHA